ncbi:MAG: lipoyl(octanoyl) transferase LipB [Thermoleophilia bacterium]|nr:lipoyl(octanoyl) transferase LipB [Thermoleophilia bacterium]
MTPPPRRTTISCFDLGLVEYGRAQRLQAELQQAVADGIVPGVLLLLEHPPVVTLGSRGTPADLVEPNGSTMTLPVMRSERGGAATLHAPGQLVSYPIIPVPGRDLRRFVWNLEEVLVRLVSDLGISAERSSGRPGLYVGAHKIASVGLRCRRWVASHGTSLNISNDLRLFEAIIACGDADLRQTSVATLSGCAPDMPTAKRAYAEHFAAVFQRTLLPPEPAAPEDVSRWAAGRP